MIPVSDTSEPTFVQTAASVQPQAASQPIMASAVVQTTASESQPKPARVALASGAQLVDGAGAGTSVGSTQTQAVAVSSPDSAVGSAQDAEKKAGLFSFLQGSKTGESSLVPVSKTSDGGGFFGIGKKKAEPETGKIDASLFPVGAVDAAPTGGALTSSVQRDEFAAEAPVAASSSSSIELPGQTLEKKRGLSLPSLPTLGKSERSGGGRCRLSPQ